jgi:hypothetical protein
MIGVIKQHPELSYFAKDDCEENGVECIISRDISADSYVILKLDQFYATVFRSAPVNTPKALDCLIVLRCMNGKFRLFLIELKSGSINTQEIIDKFETCRTDFLMERFYDIFNAEGVEYESIMSLLITSHEQDKNAGLDYLLGNNPQRILGKVVFMKHVSKQYTIQPC